MKGRRGFDIKRVHIIKLSTFMAILWAIFAIYTIDPFFTWETYSYSTYFNLFKYLIQIVLCCYIVFSFLTKKSIKSQSASILVFALFMIQFLYRTLDTSDGTVQISFGIICTVIITCAFIFMEDDQRSMIFSFFIVIFALSLLPGIVVSIAKIVHISLPYSFIESAESIKVNSHLHYRYTFFSVILENEWWPEGYRKLCGMYDEPGRVGTIAGMLLPALTFTSKNRIKKYAAIVIVLGGLMSLSVAFYVLLSCFVIIKLFENKKITLKKFIYGILGIVAGIGVLIYLALNSETFQKQILSRFTVAGIITNNNRVSNAFEMIYSNFLKSNDKWFGVGSGNTAIRTVDAAGYQIVVYTYGIIGFLLIVIWIFIMGIIFSKRNRKAIIMTIFFLMSFYQRGWIFPFYHIVILCGGISSILLDEQCGEKNIEEGKT